MRKTYLLLFMLFASMVAMAGPITPDEARQKITKFMSPRRSAAVLQDLRLVATSHYQEQSDVMSPSYYVFNVGEGQGFIIAGADDRIPAVLGYSDRGSFDPENMPVNMQAWLKGYNAQMEYLNQHPEAAAPQKTVSGSSIEPLLACEWNQGNPYNSLCPMDGDKRSVTGCVATAMAQVMYFWKYPTYTVAEIPGYTTSSKGLTVSAIAAGAAIDWDNMLPKYNGSETDAQIEAVASLMLMCGTAVQMNYTSGSSGAVTRRVADSWKDYFDYDAATNYENRSKYRLAAWNQKVYDELKAGRPVLYDGQSSGGGHAFVIDGYGGDDYFHVNWGWGGGSNDYFLLSILDSDNNSGIGASSSSDGYSFDQGAIFGAQPNTGVSPIVTPILTTSEVRTDFAEVSRTDVTEDFLASASANCWNYTGATHTFEVGYGVFDTEGQLLKAVAADWTQELDPSYGFSSLTFTIPFGANVSSGTYYLKPISREAGSETWYANLGTETNYLTATISDNTLTVMAPKFDLTGSVDASGKMEVGVPLTLTATITNNGSLYNGQLFLLVGGTSKDNLVGGRHFDIDPGATETIDFTFTPKTAGANDIYICTREYYSGSYEYTPFITGSVTIDAASEATLTMTPKTKNAVREDDQWVVKESKAIVSIDVTNTGSTDYDNDVIVKLYKLYNGNQGSPAGTFRKAIQLAAGASTTAEVELTGLEDGATYFYYVYYMSAGEEVQGYQYSPMFVVKIEGEEPPQEETAYYLVSDLNEWSTTDKSYAFTKLDDGKTWEITFPGSTSDIYLKVAPGSAYDNQETFWNNLLCADSDGSTALQGTMVMGGTGAWKLAASNDAENYTMRIVPSELTYEITFTKKEFVPQPPYYYIGTVTNWVYDATKEFTDKGDGTYSITVPAVYGDDDKTWFKVAPANAIANDGTITWAHLYSTDSEGSTQLSGTMTIGDGEAWARPKTDNAESYTITITPETKAIVIEPNIAQVTKFTVQSIDVAGSMKTNEEVDITVNVKNEGNVQTGKLYYFINNIKEGEVEVDIAAGETKAYSVKYKPTAAKDYTIKVTTDEAGETLAGEESAATKTFTVKDPDVTKFTVQSIEVAGSMKTNEEVDITVNVKNEGNVQTGTLYYFINNIKEGEIEVDIAAGETKAYSVKYKPTAAKEYTIKVTTDEAGETLAGEESAATKTFTVKDPDVTKFTVQSIDVAGSLKTNEEVDITVNVKNEGNVQTGKLYYFINNIKEGEIEVDIAAGETKAYSVKYKPTAAKEYTIKVTTDEAGETLAGEESAATKTFTVKNAEKGDPELAIQANEHFDEALGYFTAKVGQPYNSPQLSNPHNVSPIVWTSSDSSVATVDENGIVTIVGMGGTQIRADFAGNDDYKAGYAEYYLYVSDVVNYNTNDDGTVTVTGGDVSGDVEIASTVVINGQPYQVTGIADEAFKGNTTITSVTIPEGITTIGASAFDGCSNMMTVIIGKDVATIGEKAFANIGTPANAPRRAEGEGMKVECYAENVPTTAANAFEASPISNGTLLVDDNSVMAYYAAEPWSLFGTIKGFNGTEPTAIKALWADGNGTAQIFSLDGRKHGEAQKSDLMRVLNTLPKGVYIIRVGQNSKTMHN